MTVDELLSSAHPRRVQDNEWIADNLTIPRNWAQGRTAYGGISAGMIYKTISHCVDDDRVLRSFTTNFVGPLSLDAPFSIKVSLLRTGRNVSQLTGQAVQDGRVCIISQACFGVARASRVAVNHTLPHEMPTPQKARFIPQIPKVTPKFFKHFDLSFDSGGIPFTGKKTSHYHGFMRFSSAPKVMTDAHVITLIDAWPPTLLQMLRWPAPASTVSWNLEFIHPHRPMSGEDWFAYQAHTRQAADGYGHTEATIWDAHNEVIALSRQTVAIFD